VIIEASYAMISAAALGGLHREYSLAAVAAGRSVGNRRMVER
jgi:hypothetical protein